MKANCWIGKKKVRVEEDHGAQVGLKGRIAAIWAEKIGNLDRAVDAYRDLLDHAPDSHAALDALEELERKRGDFSAVQEVLVRKLQAVGPGARQIPVYKKLVALAVDKHKSPDDAIGYLHEVLQIEPDEPEANAKLLELLDKTERYNDLIDVLTEHADRRAKAGDTAGEIGLLVRAADVWEEKRAVLAVCIKQLAPRARQILEMRYADEPASPPEIARRLSWTPSAVNVALARARKFLQECTRRRLAGEGG